MNKYEINKYRLSQVYYITYFKSLAPETYNNALYNSKCLFGGLKYMCD